MKQETYCKIANAIRKDDPVSMVTIHMSSGRNFYGAISLTEFCGEYIIMNTDDGTNFVNVADIIAISI